jgi:hypothetical protein
VESGGEREREEKAKKERRLDGVRKRSVSGLVGTGTGGRWWARGKVSQKSQRRW